MTRGVFVTGTNTGVGKTLVSCAITRALLNRGVNVRAIKPVESGVPEKRGEPSPSDATNLKRAARYPGNLRDLFLYAFSEPVSPHLAAELAGQSIDPKRISEFIDQHMNACDLTLIEGAGGLLVPLSYDVLYADILADANLDLLIVSPNQLGTINATLLSIEAAKSRGLRVLGVILNRTSKADLGNREAIAAFSDVPILGTFPDAGNSNDNELADLAERFIDLRPLL